MTTLMKAFGTAALLAWAVQPVNAATDVATMTCAQFAAMDTTAQLTASNDLLLWIRESSNTTEGIADLIGKYGEGKGKDVWEKDAFRGEIEGHCSDAPTQQISVVERLMTHT